MVLQGNFLGAQVFLDGNRVVGSALDCGIIGENHHLFSLDHTDTGHDPGRCLLPVVHVPCRERTQLKEGSVGVHQPLNPVPGQQLAAASVQLHRTLPAASPHLGQPPLQVAHQGFHAGLVVQKIPVGSSQVGADYFHAIPWQTSLLELAHLVTATIIFLSKHPVRNRRPSRLAVAGLHLSARY